MNLFGIFQTLQGKKAGNPLRPPEVCLMVTPYPEFVSEGERDVSAETDAAFFDFQSGNRFLLLLFFSAPAHRKKEVPNNQRTKKGVLKASLHRRS